MFKQEYTIEKINNYMSLRLPQYKSLEILHHIMTSVDLQQDKESLQHKIHEMYPIFRDFERSFPSLTFALATGVGKTMLMGAFITYLHTNYGIKNFFVIAPNLTIYNKLIADFGNPANKKYVFKRIQEFNQNPPIIITGDTYQQSLAGQLSLYDSITINIFNIGKINAEVRGDSVPQVKRLSEYIGQSYFDYLKGLPDLVVLMDESHHYRADRGMAVINELDPMLGLELTATPQVETSKGAVKFQNVVYEYSLARAINDGFVKTPAAATRRAFDHAKYSPEETDKIKLNDGIRIHRNTKAELESYASNEGVRVIKPFVLVVCKDTAHAEEVKEFICSDEFYEGYYADKVIEVHSNQKGSEKDENIQQLLSLEDANNKIEIVIHVNMLKEGWDVTNLYTIIPLRTATSLTLREQTIGRGLRLPYGKRTGNAAVDRLTIVAHDKFEEIIAAANEETSIIKRENIIVVEEDEDLGKEKETIKPPTVFDDFIAQKEKNLKYARSREKIKSITEEIETAKAVGQAIEEVLSAPIKRPATSLGTNSPAAERVVVTSTRDLKKPEVKQIVVQKAKEILEEKQGNQISFDIDSDIEHKIESVVAPLIEQKIRFSIDIPDIVLMSKNEQELILEDFQIDTYFLKYSVPSDEILIENLADNEITTIENANYIAMPDTKENLLLGEILNLDHLISYKQNAEILYDVIGQALSFIGKDKNEDELNKTVSYYKKDIARILYDQIKGHSKLSVPEYEVRIINHVTPILQEEYTKFREDEIVKYTENIPGYEIKKKVVGYYEKACHTAYKFDSVPEHVFSIVLERDKKVLKWLRPAPRQFKIHWDGIRLYEPDFVVETVDTIYIVEIKAHNQIGDNDVKLKAKAAREYCKNVNAAYAGTDKKPWKYLLVMDNEVSRSITFEQLEREMEYYDLAVWDK